jgi:TPR repeat protein
MPRTRSTTTALDQENAVLRDGADADKLLQLGVMYSTGKSVPADLVSAHKWFNLAGMHGNREALRLRCEIAREMSSDEIAAAQRAARAWLTHH